MRSARRDKRAMRYIAGIVFASALLAATPSNSQVFDVWGNFGPGMYPGDIGTFYGPSNMMDGLTPSSRDYWSRCVGGPNVSSEQSIRACGRVIGERRSRSVSAAAHYQRAKHYEELGDAERVQADYERALDLFTQETQHSRTSPTAFYNRAGLLAHFHEYDRAIADYRHAATLNTEWDEPYYRVGAIAFRRGDYAAAITEFDRAAELDADDAYNHSARCEARAAARTDPETAAAACEEALRLTESDTYTLTSRGYLHFMRGDIEAAYSDFDAAVSADEDNLYAAYGRGVAGSRLNRQPQAEMDLTRANAGLSEDERAYYANAGLRP